jgi:hypothetical protein
VPSDPAPKFMNAGSEATRYAAVEAGCCLNEKCLRQQVKRTRRQAWAKNNMPSGRAEAVEQTALFRRWEERVAVPGVVAGFNTRRAGCQPGIVGDL